MRFLKFVLLRLIKMYVVHACRIQVSNSNSILTYPPPVIFISNHISLLDSVIYKSILPENLFICGAKEKYFSSRRRRVLMKLASIIRVSTEEKYLQDCMSLLHKKCNILIYPEMGRNSTMQRFVNWGAKVALACNATVIPLKITGTDNKQLKDIEVRVGEVIDVSTYSDVEELNEVFFQKIILL